MKAILRVLLLVAATAVGLFFSHAYAGEVTLPHTFAAGTPAVAAQVNADFAAVKSAVDANYHEAESHQQSIYSHQGHLPRAFGYVNRYFLDQLHGSDNVLLVAWNATLLRYEITIEDFTVGPSNFAAVVNATGDSPVFATIGSVDNKLLVYLFNRDGNKVQSSFHWALFSFPAF